MAKAIEQRDPLTVGHFGPGLFQNVAGNSQQIVHDGDTVITRALGNIDIRFLGIDAPEISFAFFDHPKNW